MLAMDETSTLDITVVTGMSGAGRSAAADVLEDLGFFVIDNLPPALIPKVAELGRGREGTSRFALVVDTRAGDFLPELESALAELRETGARTRVLFLDASDEVLVRRFDATRRRHPVAESESHRVSDSIARERELLERIKEQADVVVDTSELNVHELRDRLRELFGDPAGVAPSGLQISVVSFGYKHGLPLDVDLVFDCRFLPNPHWVESLRPLPGTDPKVRRYVMKQEETQAFLDELGKMFELLLPAYVREGKSYLSIGVGCTGGRHRSVVIAAEIARVLERLGFPARVHHRDLERE
jgi:RNase adapter protein RapZ